MAQYSKTLPALLLATATVLTAAKAAPADVNPMTLDANILDTVAPDGNDVRNAISGVNAIVFTIKDGVVMEDGQQHRVSTRLICSTDGGQGQEVITNHATGVTTESNFKDQKQGRGYETGPLGSKVEDGSKQAVLIKYSKEGWQVIGQGDDGKVGKLSKEEQAMTFLKPATALVQACRTEVSQAASIMAANHQMLQPNQPVKVLNDASIVSFRGLKVTM